MEGEEADEAGVSEDIDALRDGGEGLVEEVQMGLFGAGEGVEEGGGEGAGEVEDVGLQLRVELLQLLRVLDHLVPENAVRLSLFQFHLQTVVLGGRQGDGEAADGDQPPVFD